MNETIYFIDGVEFYTRRENRELSTFKKKVRFTFWLVATVLSLYVLATMIQNYQVSQSQVRHWEYITLNK